MARPSFPQQALGFVRSEKVSDCFHTRSMASKSGDIRDILIFPLLDLGVRSKSLLAFDLLELLLNLSRFSRQPFKILGFVPFLFLVSDISFWTESYAVSAPSLDDSYESQARNCCTGKVPSLMSLRPWLCPFASNIFRPYPQTGRPAAILAQGRPRQYYNCRNFRGTVDAGLSPCRYATDELVSAEKEGRHETSTV